MPTGFVLLDGLAVLAGLFAVLAWGKKGIAISFLMAFPVGLLLALVRHFAFEKLPLSEAVLRGAGHCITWWFMSLPGIILALVVRAIRKHQISN